MNKEILNKYSTSISNIKATLTIIAINIVIFITLNTIPKFATELLLYPKLDVTLQRPWTLITVFFSQESVIHIFFNMGLMLLFGTKLEKITSFKSVLLTYMISGFVGSLTMFPMASLLQWEKTVIGASAAVFGIIGAFTIICPNTRILGSKAKLWLISLFIFNIISTMLIPQKSIAAGSHTTGIITGIICGYLIKKKSDVKTQTIK